MPTPDIHIPGGQPREEPFHLLWEVKHKCGELTQKIDSLIHLFQMLETYMTYSNLMRDFEQTDSAAQGSRSNSQSKGTDAMNPQDMQKILSSVKNKDHSMTQDEFDTIFETLKQGKSQEEVARMEQMVQMAKNFLK